MDEATIKSMAAELAKGLKTPEDLNQMTAVFKKFMIETALNTELSDHLGYEKHQPKKGSISHVFNSVSIYYFLSKILSKYRKFNIFLCFVKNVLTVS